MSVEPTSRDKGVHATIARLGESLRSYIEAQYHVRNEALIKERRMLLEEEGAVAQVPFVESTPVYELGLPYRELRLPPVVSDALESLAEARVGLYSRPYVHQAQALESFFAGKDLIVATGTGSGKTESFLMPVVGQLALEASQRPESAAMHGCRALLLYPMNALVNDQLARIRRLLPASTSHVLSALMTFLWSSRFPKRRRRACSLTNSTHVLMALLAACMSMRAISSPNAIRVIRVHSECTQSAIRVQSECNQLACMSMRRPKTRSRSNSVQTWIH